MAMLVITRGYIMLYSRPQDVGCFNTGKFPEFLKKEAKHDLGLPIFLVTEPYLVGGDWNMNGL